MKIKFQKVRFVSAEIILVIFISIIFFNCEDLFINPSPIKTQVNLIKNPSFEINNKPSFSYWSTITGFVGFSNDTPTPISLWSAKLNSVDPRILAPIPGNQLYQTIKLPKDKKIYNFSFWAKLDSSYGGTARIIDYKSSAINNINSVIINDSSWKKYTVTDTLSSSTADSITIQFWGGNSLSRGNLLIDICVLTTK
jgi:hypothetical protein